MSAILARSETIPEQRLARAGVARVEARDDVALSARVLSPMTLDEFAGDIASLSERALARNVFYEGDFLVHAAHHLRDDGRPQIVTIWRDRLLVGLFPLVMPRFALGATKARGWLSHYMMDGSPLIDADGAADILRRFLAWLGEDDRSASGMMFPSIDADGPFADLLRTVSARDALPLACFDERTRAVLRIGEDKQEESSAAGKARKEWRRQERRLMQSGALTLRAATTRVEVRDAFEQFLALEARGWKGRVGSAIMQDPAAAAFARSMIRALAGAGRCRIDLMELDGAPIAATIELRAGETVSFWKIGYDEAQARFSPGVQAALKLTQRHLDAHDAALLDSCAEADHPMIDRLWPERLRVADVFIGAAADRAMAANVIVRREILRRRARGFAKKLSRKLRSLKAR